MEEELDQRATLACTVGLMRMAQHAPWSQGHPLTIHVRQWCSGATPQLTVVEPTTEPEKSNAEHLLQIGAGHEGETLTDQEGAAPVAYLLSRLSQQFNAMPPGEVKTPMDGLQAASFVAAFNSRLINKLDPQKAFSSLIQIYPIAQSMSFVPIATND